MPRLPRIHLDGAIYLISCRGQDGEMIFRDKADTQMYLEFISRYKTQHKFRLYAYTLLPERLQLLVEPGEDSTVSQIMHDLNSAYTKYFNGKNTRRGHLFESRFKSALVEKARNLVDATRHIHRQTPEGGVSSFDVYVQQEQGGEGRVPVPMEEEVRETLDFLKARHASTTYKLFCSAPLSQEDQELEKLFRRSSVIGSAEFVERVENRLKEYAEMKKEEAAALKPRVNRTLLFVLGGVIILATASSIYFYVSRQKIEAQYEAVIKQLEVKNSQNVLSDSPTPDSGVPPGGTS